MKRTLMAHVNHVADAIGVGNQASGESYTKILKYFYPELITSFLLYSALNILDSYFIADLKMTAAYATSGVTNTLFHFITKIAEGFSIGMVVLCGQYNGIGQVSKIGKSVSDAFWTTCIVGGIIASILYAGAYIIFYTFYEIPGEMVSLCVPFVRLRAIGVFFNFISFALIGFLRGVKNTRITMYIFMLGALVFITCDWLLIYGNCGCPAMGIQGSALASVIQYSVMLAASLLYILCNKENRKYGIQLFSALEWSNVRNLVQLSWPVMLDKASLAVCRMWLVKMIAGMSKLKGTMVLASFVVVEDMGRFALLPGLAFAQVITFLVSNDFRAQNWDNIASNIRKVLLIAAVMVASILLLFTVGARFIIQFFDKNGTFIDFAADLIPIVSVLTFFDLLQLILAAALRGATDVKKVMSVRILIGALYFVPASYMLSRLSVDNMFLKFILVYGSLHVGNLLMGIMYIVRFKSGEWKKQSIKD